MISVCICVIIMRQKKCNNYCARDNNKKNTYKKVDGRVRKFHYLSISKFYSKLLILVRKFLSRILKFGQFRHVSWNKLLEFNTSNKQVSKREIESCACRCNKAWGPKFKSGVELISYRESGLEEERYMRRLDIASCGNNEEAIMVY